MSKAKNVSLHLVSVAVFIITVFFAQSVTAKDPGDVKALIKAKQSIKEEPDSLGAHMKYQDAMLKDGWREQMISEYSERLKKQGETPENVYLLARIKEDIEAQAPVYHDLIKKFPDFTWGYFGSAYVSWKRGDKTEAIKLFERILEMDPKHNFTYQWIAYIYGEEQNDYEKADETILRGLQHLPEDAGLLAYHAAYLKGLGRYEEALASADKALKIEPENEEALRQRGWILASMERHKDAVAAIEAYLELWPSSVSMLEMLGLVYYELYGATYNSKSLDKAEEVWLKALELSPNLGSVYFKLHFIYLKRDWPVHLLWYAEKGLELAPDDGNAGAAETNIGSGAGMSAVSSSSQRVEIKRPKGYIRSRRDMSDKELTLLGKQDHETAWNALEETMAGSSKPNKEGIDELIKKFPTFAPLYYNRGVLGMWSYKDEEALGYLEKAVSLAKDWGRAYGALAAVQLRLKRYRAGRLTLKTAQDLDPDNPEIQFNVKLMKMFDEAVVGYTIAELKDTLAYVQSDPKGSERALFGMSMFGDYLKRDPESIEIHELYGDVFAASAYDNYWHYALDAYRKAIELGGDKNRLSAKVAEIEGRKK